MIRKHLLIHYVLVLALQLAAVTAASGQGVQQQGDRFVIPLSSPGQPVKVHVGLVYGSISVEPHANANEVVLEARADDDDDHDSHGGEGRRGGMRRLPNRSLGLVIEEEDNRVKVVTSGSPDRGTALRITVPRQTSLKLATVNDGDITVQGVEGELEVRNTNGSVVLRDVGGAVVAHTVNGEVKVTLTRLDPKASLSFTTLNGNVDVTLPPETRGALRLRSDNGEIFTDFDVDISASPARVEEKRSGGRYRLEVEQEVRGTINGGGAEIQMRTFNGNIYLRKRGG